MPKDVVIFYSDIKFISYLYVFLAGWQRKEVERRGKGRAGEGRGGEQRRGNMVENILDSEVQVDVV